MPWLYLSTDILDDPDIDAMPDDVAWEKFLACARRGETNEFSPYVRVAKGGSRQFNPDWPKIRAKVLKRDGRTCSYCGSKDGPFECDHIIPVAQGGSDSLDNLTTACRPCNRRKKDKTPAEWLGS